MLTTCCELTLVQHVRQESEFNSCRVLYRSSASRDWHAATAVKCFRESITCDTMHEPCMLIFLQVRSYVAKKMLESEMQTEKIGISKLHSPNSLGMGGSRLLQPRQLQGFRGDGCDLWRNQSK